MRVYYDGSWNEEPGRSVSAWGLVLVHGDETTELSGARVSHRQHASGTHELVAFIEAVLYLDSHGHDPRDVVFLTDDATTVYGVQCEVNGINSGHTDAAHRLLARLARAGMYQQAVLDRVWAFALQARFHWVKGHLLTVYNQRADYLARRAAMAHKVGQRVRVLGFETWLMQGFSSFDPHLGRSKTWHVPFAPRRRVEALALEAIGATTATDQAPPEAPVVA